MTYIKDRALKPLKFQITESGVSIVEASGVDKDGKLLHKIHGYYTNLDTALRKAVKILTIRELADFNEITIEQYLKKQEEIVLRLEVILTKFK